jgi:hypothetical protein
MEVELINHSHSCQNKSKNVEITVKIIHVARLWLRVKFQCIPLNIQEDS